MSAEPEAIERVRLTADDRNKLKQERRNDADKVWVEITQQRAAELAKTDRLRALRLAKEEADRLALAAAKPKPATRRAKTTKA